MEAKVKKFFSEIFVNTYDYPFIIGFLEANGIYGVVPSLKKKENRTFVNYEMFKDWWKQNYKEDHQEGTMVSIDYGDFDIHTEVNPENGLIEYTITQGNKSAVITLDENENTFLFSNFRKAGRILLERSKLNDFGDFLHKFKIYKFLC